MAGRQLHVWVNGQRIGILQEANDLWSFDYDDAWMAATDGFSLSPALPRSKQSHVDGATDRPVQWYFDNLLPEETMRTVLAKEAKLSAEDAFGFLAHFGAESAGSLVLLPPGIEPSDERGLKLLPLDVLSKRIRNLPQRSLSKDSPKRMSLAGAQHKLVIVMKDGYLYEPLPGTPSTHILKPDHPSPDYSASVINEYFVMHLADLMGLKVPRVTRLYVPEPVYIIERFDRTVDENTGLTRRTHIIDSCQLLNKSRSFKYSAARLATLAAAVGMCRSRAKARVSLFRWLAFNFLLGNNDNHLKNISFTVESSGIEVAPFYDILSTQAYSTRAMANDRATWPNESLAIPLGNATITGNAGFEDLLAAGTALGLAKATCERELGGMVTRLPGAAEKASHVIEDQADQMIAKSPQPEVTKSYMAGEFRLLRAIVSIVIRDTVRLLASPTGPKGQRQPST